jgi:hypothetical protein
MNLNGISSTGWRRSSLPKEKPVQGYALPVVRRADGMVKMSHMEKEWQ